MKQYDDMKVRSRGVGLAFAALAVLISLSGCTTVHRWFASKRNRGALLAPRAIVPAPYAEPPAQPIQAPPAEPLPPVVVSPAGPPPTPAPAPGRGGEIKKTTPPKVVLPPPPPPAKVLKHKVAKGESFWSIARMYGVSMAELAAYNNMSLNQVLHVGAVLRIPPGGHYIPPEKRGHGKRAAAKKHGGKRRRGRGKASRSTHKKHSYEPLPASGKYTVKPGDSLWKIAHRFGLKSADIRRVNHLQSDVLQIGQVLVLPRPGKAAPTRTPIRPKPAPPPTPAPAPKNTVTPAPSREKPAAAATAPAKATAPVLSGDILTEYPKRLEHSVLPGDTIDIIAKMYHTKREAILKANPQIKSDADLKPGMIVIVPY